MNWRRNTKLFEFRNIRFTRHYSFFENEFWTKFKRLFVTSISIRIKTFRIIAFNWITHSINRISYTVHRILFAINSEIVISRTLSAAKISYSRDEDAAIINKIASSIINKTIISRVINSEKFSETIIFIFISIEAKFLQSSISSIRKSLQWFIISIRKSLHSFRKEINAQTIFSISFFKILSFIWIIWAIL